MNENIETSDSNSQGKPNFGSYGKHFQECVMAGLLSDHQWSEQMMEVFETDYFELKYIRFLAEKYFAYSRKYKVFPTLQMLVTIIRDDLKTGSDVLLRDQIIDYLTRIRTNPMTNDLQFAKDKALDFCRKQALKRALESAVDQMQAEKYESIVETIKKAVTVGTTPALGHDFFQDQEARFTRLQRRCVPTGIEQLDQKEIFNGGVGAGELAIVCAPTGVGKSHFLVQMGANAMKNGIDVLHYTLELSETAVGVRYDSNLCEIDSSNVLDSKEEILEKYKNMKLGKLMIKEFPTNTASIYSIRSHMERLSLKGFNPGLIIIDYADIMRSTRQYDSLRHELKLIYEELRGLATEKKIPIWTASQSNKEGSNSDIVDLTNMSEAYGKAMVADVVLGISRKSSEKATGWGRLFISKNRAGRDGLLYPIQINTARSKFTIAGEVGTPEQVTSEAEGEMKRAIREKWKELQGEIKFISPEKNDRPLKTGTDS